ncbi:hypothetical protein H5V45_07065 [Nocardioides sp. KIGAM211]|uniref:Uncharacterized protein n=1 Tax=Nocardioides luti TaxID=2761101 RepID=A0A7X0RHE9_9ACTN|nr:hypothetical protein [Nocardioides luti]MBB6627079.1 hypothetical protein [Nocardioides luti]
MSVTTAPFACTYDDGTTGALTEGLEGLNGKRVTQCALSRICGSCGRPLGRPIAFVGSGAEVARNAFHFPPLHLACAEQVVQQVATWQLVTTAGFEFVRPAKQDIDRRPTFEPNSLL